MVNFKLGNTINEKCELINMTQVWNKEKVSNVQEFKTNDLNQNTGWTLYLLNYELGCIARSTVALHLVSTEYYIYIIVITTQTTD